jgi:DNA repair protein RadA/Sms
MTAKTRTAYRCTACGVTSPKWAGRCGGCQAWGTVEEQAPQASRSVGLKGSLTAAGVTVPAQRMRDVDTGRTRHRPTGIGEFDRVLGGGMVAGGVVLLAGEPGAGKSTLLLQVAHQVAETGATVLIISGEESREQIKLRAERIGADSDLLFLAAEQDLSVALGHVEQVQPDLLIVDSVQTLASPAVEGRAGGVSQVAEVAHALTRVAKERGMPLMLVGQVTKDNTVAGPRVVEHLVDAVLHFEGDRNSTLRLLRTVKNRYGAADEVACFEQTDTGLREVTDPSGLFTDAHAEPVPGSCLTVNMDGRRALLAEVQALVNQSFADKPRRGVSGLDPARVNLLLAVLEARGGVRLGAADVFASTVGGIRISDPAVDLAVALATASSAKGEPMPAGVVALGEIGLSGAIRPVPGLLARLREARRLGCRSAVVPLAADVPEVDGLVLARVGTLGDALRASRLT